VNVTTAPKVVLTLFISATMVMYHHAYHVFDEYKILQLWCAMSQYSVGCVAQW